MKTLYLECAMGAAGDMLLGALTELMDKPDAFVDELNALGIPHVKYLREKAVRHGIHGTHMRVLADGEEEISCDVMPSDHPHIHEAHKHMHEHEHTHEHEHEHGHTHEHGHAHSHRHGAGFSELKSLIQSLRLPPKVEQDALAVYELIANAESAAHDAPVDMIHFHEVGAMDAVADIVGCAYAVNRLAPDRIAASPVHVGGGFVRCAHGILPVPAPAAAHLLKGIPMYGSEIHAELCTPTGAALLRYFVESFGPLPQMCIETIGYGMGTKDFETLNCLRAFLGEDSSKDGQPRPDVSTPDSMICELVCNLDDMTPEALGYAMEVLMEKGALDVYFSPVQMKKNRPGVLLTCLCTLPRREEFKQLIIQHTTTRGVRERCCARTALPAQFTDLQTCFGTVRLKISGGKHKPEYDDVRRLARENDVPYQRVLDAVAQAYVQLNHHNTIPENQT